MSDFIPGYSDEPQYWTNSFKNQYIKRNNIAFLNHKLSQVCRSKFECYGYYEGFAVRIYDLKDKSAVEEVLRHYVGKKYILWSNHSGWTINGLEVNMSAEIYGDFINAEEDGYVLKPLLPDDGLGTYPVGVRRY